MVNQEDLANQPPQPPENFSPWSKTNETKTAPPLPPQSSSSEPAQDLASEEKPASSSKLASKGWLKWLLLVLLTGLVVMAYFLIFAPDDQPSSGSTVTIEYWGLWEPESVMSGLIEEFEEANPGIKVNYTQQSVTDYRQRLQSALASGSGPDIFRIHNTWLPMFINDLSSVPDDLVNSLALRTDYYPVVTSTLSSGGDFYALPLMIDTLALFYNQDIFDQYGLEPPQDWDEFRQIASQLTIRDDNGVISRAGAAMGTASNVDHWSDILGLMMIQNGADIAGPYQDDALQALEFFMVFSKTDLVWDETLPESTRAFAGGKLALYFGPSWRIINIRQLNPELNFGIVAVPQLPDKTPVSWATFWAEGVSNRSTSQEQEASWQFLEFLSQDESLERLYKAGSQVHYIGQLYPKISLASKLTTDPLLAPFIEQADYAQSWYLSSRTADNGINDGIIQYFADAVNRSLLNADPDLETTVTQGVNSILTKYGVD